MDGNAKHLCAVRAAQNLILRAFTGSLETNTALTDASREETNAAKSPEDVHKSIKREIEELQEESAQIKKRLTVEGNGYTKMDVIPEFIRQRQQINNIALRRKTKSSELLARTS